jgi:hypothetical protein
MDRVNDVSTGRRARVHGGPGGGADSRTVARQALQGSEARWCGPGRERVMRRSRQGDYRSTAGGGEAARRRGRTVAAQARCKCRREQERAWE